MKRVAYILPGYRESHLKQGGYTKMAKFFEAQGITPVHVEIDWRRQKPERLSDYTEQFLRVYKREKDTAVYILGFSYGAMIAFLTAAQTKPDVLVLCSLSPYFEEDLKNLKPAWLRSWKKDFIESDYSFAKLASRIKSKTYLIVGEKEHASCLIRARDAKKKLSDSHLRVVRGAKHKIGQKQYLAAIEKVVHLS